MISIDEFCRFHGACPEGRKWALAECRTMDDVWQRAKGEWLIWVATRPGVATSKEQRLLAVHAARSVSHMLTSPDLLRAIEVAERHAHGLATDEELAAASAAAWAASDAARAVERAAEGAAEGAAERAAELAASWAAEGAALAAERAAEGAAAWAASAAERAAARDAQAAAWGVRCVAQTAAWAARGAAQTAAWEGFAEWARENIKPDFTRLVSRDG